MKISSKLLWGNPETYFTDGNTEVHCALYKYDQKINRNRVISKLSLRVLGTLHPTDVGRGVCGSWFRGFHPMPSVHQFWGQRSTLPFLISNHHLLLEVNPKALAAVLWQSVTWPDRNTSSMVRVLQATISPCLPFPCLFSMQERITGGTPRKVRNGDDQELPCGKGNLEASDFSWLLLHQMKGAWTLGFIYLSVICLSLIYFY